MLFSDLGTRPVDRKGIDQCTGCGLCLDVCPTYQETRHEGHSPRGRLRLMADEAPGLAASYLAACLKCGLCESVCPTEVPYKTIVRQYTASHYRVDAGTWSQRVEERIRLVASEPGTLVTLTAIATQTGAAVAPRLVKLAEDAGLPPIPAWSSSSEPTSLDQPRLLLVAGALLRTLAPDAVHAYSQHATRGGYVVVRDSRAEGLLPFLEAGLIDYWREAVVDFHSACAEIQDLERVLVLDPQMAEALRTSHRYGVVPNATLPVETSWEYLSRAKGWANLSGATMDVTPSTLALPAALPDPSQVAMLPADLLGAGSGIATATGPVGLLRRLNALKTRWLEAQSATAPCYTADPLTLARHRGACFLRPREDAVAK